MSPECELATCKETGTGQVGGRWLCQAHLDLYLLHPTLSTPELTIQAFLVKMQGFSEAPYRIKFIRELEEAINGNSIENDSNTPDWILAELLNGVVHLWNIATIQREDWYGHRHTPGGKAGIGSPAIHAHTAPKCDCGAAPDRPHTHGIGRAETPNLGEAA